MIAKALKWDVDKNAVSEFNDVSDWAQPYVAKAVELGITNGKGDNVFGGKDSVTGKELGTWILRAIGEEPSKAWNQTSMCLNQVGLWIDSKTSTIYNRELLVKAIYESIQLKPIYPDDAKYTLLEEIIKDDTNLISIAEKHGLIAPDSIIYGEIEEKNKDSEEITVVELTNHLDLFNDKVNARNYFETSVAHKAIELNYKIYDFIPATFEVDGAPTANEENHDTVDYEYDGYSVGFDDRNEKPLLRHIFVQSPSLYTYEGLDIGDVLPEEFIDKYYNSESGEIGRRNLTYVILNATIPGFEITFHTDVKDNIRYITSYFIERVD